MPMCQAALTNEPESCHANEGAQRQRARPKTTATSSPSSRGSQARDSDSISGGIVALLSMQASTHYTKAGITDDGAEHGDVPA